jgi:hypothetical protein
MDAGEMAATGRDADKRKPTCEVAAVAEVVEVDQ